MKHNSEHPPEYLSAGVSSRRLPQPLIKALRRMVNRLAGFTRFNATYSGVIADGIPDNLAECFLNHIAVKVEINRGGLDRIPRAGPLIVVANHPFGMIDGLMLNAVVTAVRSDYKCLAAYEIGKIPGLSRTQFVVDPMKSRKRRMNLAAWHGVFKWVKDGRVFAIFPAGRASRFSFRHRRVTDIAWSRHVATLARRTGVPVLPVYFPGSNGVLFQLVGLIYGDLQNFLLIPVFNRMHGRRFKVLIGEVIEPDVLRAMDSDQQVIDYLRDCTYALAPGVESAQYVQLTGAGSSTIS
ncbi:MAG: 1-acyl-sn-glycerol-3-phosphate acyltransferase [Candidatus Binatia bacterium]